MRLLTVDEVIRIQKSTLPKSGESNIDKLSGALGRVQSLIDYDNCDDLFDLAGMYLVAIAKAHAFNDANKRTAFQAATIFLKLNNIKLFPSVYLVKLTILSAMGEFDYKQASATLRILSDYRDDLVEETRSGYI
ncbi:type II toxin-antitoxin system death-on-curing family toxin [Providencia sp. PROV040]|uniref:type II toxin-antitoxin system death-on-curing family toxin n=1 Tax=Providencia sp. PROV040 TaxID=2949771 RepID=UPI002934224E|nr:type II toxin-antitoxin system death-on-curing family toxin [Providencia sp. PROV040]WOB87392.1 type II toxin-antitoxin system death-on-curing family toxin [Providencia sp. PROV040]